VETGFELALQHHFVGDQKSIVGIGAARERGGAYPARSC
jgi:hypothetical protein